MKRSTLFLAAVPLALAVSPLIAQQDDTPARPAADPAAPAAAEEATVEAVEEAVDAEDAPSNTDEEIAEAVEAAEAQAEAAELLVEEAVPLLQAQQGVVRAQQLVVGGNAQLLIGPGGGFGGGVAARQFSTEIDGLPELVMNAVTDGVTRDSDPSSYRFEAEGPGLLTVAVRAKNRDDMTIEVYNERGQQLGRCDIDFGGNTGAEHLAIPIAEAGLYRVVVDPLGSGGPYWIGSSWLAFQELEAMAPATPDDAIEVTPGEPQEGAVAAGGPHEQWYVFTAPSEGLLVFSTGDADGDLVIEAYNEDRFDQNVQYSDQDRNGHSGNERILMDMVEGQVIYFKVRPLSSGRNIDYTTRAQFMDTSE